MILVLAQNPKTMSNINTPLLGTKSFHTFKTWLRSAGIEDHIFVFKNAIPHKLTGPFTTIDITAGADLLNSFVNSNDSLKGINTLRNDRVKGIITLGKVAAKVVVKSGLDIPVLNLPHPSGLNRALNNPSVREQIPVSLKSFVREVS